MSELILSKETVGTTINLFPKIEHLLTFDERVAFKAYMNGDPTDEQQMIVYNICKMVIKLRVEGVGFVNERDENLCIYDHQ